MFDEDQKLFTVLIYKWLHTHKHTHHTHSRLYACTLVHSIITLEWHIKENNNNNNNKC